MYKDIVFPKNNEEGFILMAKRLGYSSLCFTYDYKNKNQVSNIRNKIISIKQKSKFNLLLALKVKQTEILRVKKLCDLIICESSDKNRWVFEKTKDVIVYNLEFQKKNDFMHHRNSGLNQVLCKFAHKNNVTIGVSFSSILNSDNRVKSFLLGRISQNIKLCRKYKVNMLIGSFASDKYEMRSYHDLISFGILMGMNSGEAKRSMITF